MGVFSELDLENQQAELEGHDSKAAEMQTLQAKLIQQHEQKKAAAAEAPGKEPAAEPVAKTEAEPEDPAAAETERRRQHEEAEAKRKAEWERQQAEKRAAEQTALAKIEQMSETELIKASMECMKKRNRAADAAEPQGVCFRVCADALPQRSRVRADGHAPAQEHGTLSAIHQPESTGVSARRNGGQRYRTAAKRHLRRRCAGGHLLRLGRRILLGCKRKRRRGYERNIRSEALSEPRTGKNQASAQKGEDKS